MSEYKWWASLPESEHYVPLEAISIGIAGLQHPDDDLARVIAEEGIRKQLRRWVTQGRVTVRNPGEGYMPVDGNLFFTGGVLNRIDLERFSNECGVGLRIVPVNVEQPPVATEEEPTPSDAWKELAKSAARTIIARQAKRDLYPTQVAIADEIARDFRQRVPKVVGADGKPLSGAYIKRQTLKGISSAVKKAQSTKNCRGK